MAANEVHRPSPESDTRPANPSSPGESCSASEVRSSSQEETTPSPPELGDRAHIEVVRVVLRVREGRRLGVLILSHKPGIGMVEQVEALRIRCHQAVLDPVVDHLHEVTRAAPTAVEVSMLLRRGRPGSVTSSAARPRGPVQATRRSAPGARTRPYRRRSSGNTRAPGRRSRRSCRSRGTRFRALRAPAPDGCRREVCFRRRRSCRRHRAAPRALKDAPR